MRGFDLNDGMFAAGFCSLAVGCWMAYAPAAPIVCGTLLIAVSVVSAVRKARP